MSTDIRVLSTGCLLLCSTALSAAPTVTGNTITWPDDGWYQVQSASDYSQICAGVESCTVEAGAYIVINHTSGQRFDNIVVVDEAGGDVPGVSVSDGTIAWPDDGWYQVQRSDTYESVCNGGRSCDVDPGTYIVINHTTGQRYTGIDVSDEGSPSTTAVLVEGDTISWPDDGWYQVQSIPDYVSICNGGSSCTVEAGSYVVINHTSGARTAVVVDNDSPIGSSEATINSGNYREIISSVLKVYTGSPDYTDEMYELPNYVDLDRRSLSYDDEGNQELNWEYNCGYDGSVSVEYFNTTRGDGNIFVFNDCVEGAARLQGTLKAYDFIGQELVEADSYRENIASKYGPNLRQSFSGRVGRSVGSWGASSFDYYFNNRIDISDGNYSWGRNVTSGGSFSTGIYGSFTYKGATSGSDLELSVEAVGMSISLSPQDTRELQGSYGYLDATPFMALHPEEGTLEIVAEDGSRLLMNAATGDMNTVSIDIETSDAATSMLENWSNWSAELRTDVLGASR